MQYDRDNGKSVHGFIQRINDLGQLRLHERNGGASIALNGTSGKSALFKIRQRAYGKEVLYPQGRYEKPTAFIQDMSLYYDKLESKTTVTTTEEWLQSSVSYSLHQNIITLDWMGFFHMKTIRGRSIVTVGKLQLMSTKHKLLHYSIEPNFQQETHSNVDAKVFDGAVQCMPCHYTTQQHLVNTVTPFSFPGLKET